jgi:hypothetical protein
MFAGASDAAFADLPSVVLTLLTSIFGTVRSVFERHLPVDEADGVLRHLVLMCATYLEAIKSPPDGAIGAAQRNPTPRIGQDV